MTRKMAVAVVIGLLAMALIALGFMDIPAVKAAQISNHDISQNILRDDAQPAETLELTCQYPALSSYAGVNYAYTISVTYSGGKESKIFDLKAVVPDGFVSSIAPGYGEGQEIASIRLDASKAYPETVKLSVRPYAWKVPVPGEYPITFEVSSGDLKSSILLKAIVTAAYDLKMATPDGRLNTEATAGQDNNFTVTVTNSGSADLENVEVSCQAKDRPNSWTVTCKPDKIDSLKAGDTKEIQVTVRPSEKTIAGDYMITVQAEPNAKNAFTNLQIRTTVLTPTIWGWVGVGIVLLVVIALAVIFVRFGRR
ncbi:MAG: NEW3 domain-containing protein [Chloroflexi bacterium]|nr:NEW3 domain-containing protein [Chloroflexota bacterium]